MGPVDEEREARRRAGRPYDLIVAEHRHRAAKRERILALEPLVHTGRLLFHEALGREVLAQLEDFPGGRHDDGPDAVAAAVKLARQSPDPRDGRAGLRQF